MRRRTLVEVVEKNGLGAARGEPCTVRLQPAAWGTGMVLVFPSERVVLDPSNLEGDSGLVWFGEESELAGSEPMLAACALLGLTDLEIVVEGEDCPVLDGTLAPWLGAMEAAGWVEGPAVTAWTPDEPLFASTDEGFAVLAPSDSLEVAVRHPGPGGRVDEGLVPIDAEVAGVLLAECRRVVPDLAACQARGEWLGLTADRAASSEEELRTPDEATRFQVVMAIAATTAIGPCITRIVLEGTGMQALVAVLGAVSNRHA